MIRKIVLLSSLALSITAAHAQTVWKFDFGAGKVQPGYTQVLPGTKYTQETGYGFDLGSMVTSKSYAGKDALKSDYITSQQPFYFSVKLPEGNYHVKVILGDPQGMSVTTIKAECRRLMVEKVQTAQGKFTTQEFTVHVKDSLIRTIGSKVRLKPRERAYLHWDDKLTLEFNNSAAKVCGVEISPAAGVPTIFLAGNSTVVDQSEEPWASWGQDRKSVV